MGGSAAAVGPRDPGAPTQDAWRATLRSMSVGAPGLSVRSELSCAAGEKGGTVPRALHNRSQSHPLAGTGSHSWFSQACLVTVTEY